MRSSRNALALSVVILASGCATTVPPVKLTPPVELLADCVEPPGGYKTNGELLRYSEALKEALRGCTADKRALRAWAELPE